jgi:hypothetical protein
MSDIDDLADMIEVPPRPQGRRSVKLIKAGKNYAKTGARHGHNAMMRKYRGAAWASSESTRRRGIPVTLPKLNLPPVVE